MNKAEFTDALRIAKDATIDLTDEEIGLMDGYGLPDFKPVSVSTRQVARMVRWQAQYIFGGWDAEEINSIRQLGRKRFEINNEVENANA